MKINKVPEKLQIELDKHQEVEVKDIIENSQLPK